MWAGLIYGLVVTTWGAFPGHPSEDIQSGRFVKNFVLDNRARSFSAPGSDEVARQKAPESPACCKVGVIVSAGARTTRRGAALCASDAGRLFAS